MKVHTDKCKGCAGQRLVICHRDGDIVCTSCGLVQEAHIVDDTMYGNACFAEEHEGLLDNHYEPLKDDKTHSAEWHIFSKASLSILGDDFQQIVEEAHQLFESVTKTCKGMHKKALYCVCFLNACRNQQTGVDATQVYRYFEVPTWQHYSKLCNLVKPSYVRDYDKTIKRMVYECVKLEEKQMWQVIKIACHLQEKIMCVSSKVKMSKMNACLIYVSAKINKIEWISMEYISKLYNVSLPTLKKHELLIQGVLTKCT